MAHAYTPGLKVRKYDVIRKVRRLPIKGRVLVNVGDYVKAEDTIAKADLPGNVHPLNVAGLLSIPPEELRSVMLKKEGDEVKKGEVIARTKGIFGLFKSQVTSPVDGAVESISTITGQVILREPPIPVEVKAYIDGVVKEVYPEEGVLIETYGSIVQGIFGVGGERVGVLKVLVGSPYDELKEENITGDLEGKIIVGGSFVGIEAIKKAIEKGVCGIVVGGVDDKTIRELLGYDIGVAITGGENIPLTLIITEGFGWMPIAKRTYELLRSLEGKKASINGATQIRAGVIRPEIIVPDLGSNPRGELEEGDIPKEGLVEGSVVRIIREPYFGRIGKVVSLPPELRLIETEAKVRVVEVELEDGLRVIIPRANVEILEE